MKDDLALNVAFRGRAIAVLARAVVGAIVAVSTIGITMGICVGAADAERAPMLVVLPFEIYDTSGEVGPANRHDAMLARTTTLVRDQIAAAQLYQVVPEALTDAAVAAQHTGTYLRNCNGCEIDIAKRLGARYVLIGWIYKVSTLILTLHIDIKDVDTGKTVYAHVFDFRGDNEPAYAHAAKTLVRSLTDEQHKNAGSGALETRSDPIKIAVFDFELEDFSAASAAGTSPLETKYLAQATEEARRMLDQSGRYAIVKTDGADLAAAGGHGLRNCRGCEAAIAAKLGAEQAMIGVVTKISMTEYTVTVQLSDARKGAVIETVTTGLRMGADYTWVRGATWLTNRVLASRGK